MKKALILTTIIISLFFNVTKINAACEDKELLDWASNLTASYQEDIEITDANGNITHEKEYLYYILLKSKTNYDFKDKIKVISKDTESTTSTEGKYIEAYKSYGVGSYVHFSEKKYTITIYGSDTSSCKDHILKTITVKVPKYNMYANSKFCYEYPDDELCKTNYDTTGTTKEEINEIMQEKEKEYQNQNLPTSKKILNFINESWYYVVIPFILIAGYYTIKRHNLKKKVDNQ